MTSAVLIGLPSVATILERLPRILTPRDTSVNCRVEQPCRTPTRGRRRTSPDVDLALALVGERLGFGAATAPEAISPRKRRREDFEVFVSWLGSFRVRSVLCGGSHRDVPSGGCEHRRPVATLAFVRGMPYVRRPCDSLPHAHADMFERAVDDRVVHENQFLPAGGQIHFPA